MAKYSLRDNPLTEDPNDKLAALEDVKSLTKEEIIDRILKRGNTMTKTDLLAAINAYEEECAIITEEGSAINTPLFNTSLAIQGKFDNGDDVFDLRRHALKVNVAAGTVLKEAAGKVKLTKVQGTTSAPWITGVRDTLSDAEDRSGNLKAGSVIEVTGAKLKFDNADGEQGVFLVGGASEIRCTQVVENKPSKVLFVLPMDTAAGSYTLEVRTKNTGNKTDGKTLKKGAFEKSVTVA
ncbi:DNA-binding domain-containing protein [Treponema saccharophilum]|uniref:Uncharacterized protein n=1 Tax=Treponema saccharophilum DSM 2985 TaxID=907348 RepID=H7EJT9_9SPIR|nr:DNA-binding domain-containing protein [Treponema saccharophilum]EIC02209.1 hypothetical protein TresaDRAFT_2189 [Treponema saccharophilum DSM 2985]BDC96667.1 hypothetical protein TRSA_17660 [Treponema saccharophilum]